jgi:hypothetical protein
MCEVYPLNTTFQKRPSGYLFCHILTYSQISMTLTCLSDIYCDRSSVKPSCPGPNIVEMKVRMEVVIGRSSQSLDTAGLMRFTKNIYRDTILLITM